MSRACRAALLTLIALLVAAPARACAGAGAGAETRTPPPRAVGFESRPIYHSPQTPGYSAWCTLWRTRGGELRLAFQQVTGPADDWTKRTNVTVILGSDEQAAAWKPLREVPARTNAASQEDKIYAAPASSSFCGHGIAALADGTLVTGLWPTKRDKSGYVQRSTDEGLTWSPPIFLVDPEQFRVYPTQVHSLRDGRLLFFAGVYAHGEKESAANVRKAMFESRDAGQTWGPPIWIMPREVGVCEESDFVELDNGDLLFIHRTEHYDGDLKYLGSNRLQNIFRRKAGGDGSGGGGWAIGPFTEVPMPHSGFPELLKTRNGSILHIGTDGVWHTGPDLHTWSRLDLPGSPYYPRATQLKDGRILVVGHVGGDDEYGKVDQTIVQQTFYLETPRDGGGER
jgi:hypothetical protein